MYGEDHFLSLDFNNDGVLNQEVDSISHFEPNALINQRQAYLTGNNKPRFPKFMSQTGFVGVLQNSRAKPRMNSDGATDNDSRDVIGFHLRTLG